MRLAGAARPPNLLGRFRAARGLQPGIHLPTPAQRYRRTPATAIGSPVPLYPPTRSVLAGNGSLDLFRSPESPAYRERPAKAWAQRPPTDRSRATQRVRRSPSLKPDSLAAQRRAFPGTSQTPLA